MLVGPLEATVAEHPLRERLRGQLMVALYRSGRQAEALRAYRAAREQLVSELGVEPGPDLQRLEAAVLAHDPALARPVVAGTAVRPAAVAGDGRRPSTEEVTPSPRQRPRSNVALPLTSTVGRTDELRHLAELVHGHRLVRSLVPAASARPAWLPSSAVSWPSSTQRGPGSSSSPPCPTGRCSPVPLPPSSAPTTPPSTRTAAVGVPRRSGGPRRPGQLRTPGGRASPRSRSISSTPARG